MHFLKTNNDDKTMSTDKSRKYSQKIVDGTAQAPSRSMLRAVG
ncbi:MAG: dihydroxy-acid dehydratase, partial [Oleiphilaceae bacterium]